MIIKVQVEQLIGVELCGRFIDQVYESLIKYLITSKDKWFDISKTTYGDLISQSKKRIHLSFYEERFEIKKNWDTKKKGFHPMEGHYRSKWPNTNDTDQLFFIL